MFASVRVVLNRQRLTAHPNEFPTRMYIMLAGLRESRMIENCPLTKRRDCSPGNWPGAAQTGQPAGDLP